jgi:hypothetical protein
MKTPTSTGTKRISENQHKFSNPKINRMKSLILLAIFGLSTNFTFGQSNFGQPKDSSNFEIKIHPDFFLLGTFSDYLGRFQYIDRENQIDRYYPYEESLAKYLNSYIYQNYNQKGELKVEKTKHSKLSLPALAKKIHSEYFDEAGNFIDQKLDTDEKRYSFLLGLYLRYGEKLDDNIYKIQVVNSPKDKPLYSILKELECDKIFYKFLRGYIPSSDFFYFAATPRMIKYFNTIDKENKELIESKKQKFGDSIDAEKRKELNAHREFEQTKLVESLKTVFK